MYFINEFPSTYEDLTLFSKFFIKNVRKCNFFEKYTYFPMTESKAHGERFFDGICGMRAEWGDSRMGIMGFMRIERIMGKKVGAS